MTSPEQLPETPEAAATWISPEILAAIGVWLAAVAPVVVVGSVVNPAAMWQFQNRWNREVDRLDPYLKRMARYGWEAKNRALGTNLPWNRDDPNLVELLQRTHNLLVRVPDETYRQIIRIMATARDRGEDQARIAARVSNLLDVNGSENWPNRALVIARTELNRFYQAGGLAGMRAAEQSTGRTILKMWKDEDDSRVRRAHAVVDNQLRRLGEPFQVGKSMLQQPIDPSGAPEDVIQCRCDLEYRWGR